MLCMRSMRGGFIRRNRGPSLKVKLSAWGKNRAELIARSGKLAFHLKFFPTLDVNVKSAQLPAAFLPGQLA